MPLPTCLTYLHLAVEAFEWKLNQGNYPKAVGHFRTLIQLFPNNTPNVQEQLEQRTQIGKHERNAKSPDHLNSPFLTETNQLSFEYLLIIFTYGTISTQSYFKSYIFISSLEAKYHHLLCTFNSAIRKLISKKISGGFPDTPGPPNVNKTKLPRQRASC